VVLLERSELTSGSSWHAAGQIQGAPLYGPQGLKMRS